MPKIDYTGTTVHFLTFVRPLRTDKWGKRAIKVRTPFWSDLDKIREIYDNCPDGNEVDHIYPLRGKLINGLQKIFSIYHLKIIAVNQISSFR